MNDYSTSELVDVGIRALQAVQKQIVNSVKDNPARAFRRLTREVDGKPALAIDENAEDSFERELHTYRRGWFKGIVVHGEESLANPKLDLTNSPGTIVLADIVDGTDLLERGLGNWCSAVVFFTPKNRAGKRIRAAMVALPPDGIHGQRIYVAHDSDNKAFVFEGNGKQEVKLSTRVAGPSKVSSLAESSLCFYGQKAKNFTSTSGALFGSDVIARERTARIYNLAGMPMIVRLIDQRYKDIHGIDAVFDVCGQQPHDVVPGAFIAKKAGVAVKDLSGADIGYARLEQLLLKPTSTALKYVIAASDGLAAQLVTALSSQAKGEAA